MICQILHYVTASAPPHAGPYSGNAHGEIGRYSGNAHGNVGPYSGNAHGNVGPYSVMPVVMVVTLPYTWKEKNSFMKLST